MVEGDAEVERRRPPAVRRGDALDALDGGRRARGDPQPAVGGEALLRGEVVDVDLGRVPRQAAGAGRGVDGDERAVAPGRPAQVHRHAGRRLVVGEGVDVDVGVGDGVGVVAGVAADDDRVVEVRGGGAGLGELRRELAEHEVLAALLDEPERGDVPEHRRAAVAEHDLPAVGQAEQVGQPGAHGADELLDRRLAVRRAHHASARRRATASSCSGRTLDGPQPKRPSAGQQVRGDAQRGGGGDRSL